MITGHDIAKCAGGAAAAACVCCTRPRAANNITLTYTVYTDSIH